MDIQSEPFYVIIPAYNEGRSVGRVVLRLLRSFPAARIAVINDGSTDDTAYQAKRGGASVINLPFNTGYGVALQTGLIWAKAKTRRW